MRLPTLAKRMGLDGSKGISNLLVGTAKGSEVLQKSGLHPTLMVLPAGGHPPQPLGANGLPADAGDHGRAEKRF